MNEHEYITHRDTTWEIRHKDGKLIRWGKLEAWEYMKGTWERVPSRSDYPYKWFKENKGILDVSCYEIRWITDTFIKKTEIKTESADEAIKQAV